MICLKFSGSSGLIYIDPSSIRRATGTTASVSATVTQECTVAAATTSVSLARAFAIVMRQIADLMTMLQDYNNLMPNLARVLEVTPQDAMHLQVCICMCIKIVLYDQSIFQPPVAADLSSYTCTSYQVKS